LNLQQYNGIANNPSSNSAHSCSPASTKWPFEDMRTKIENPPQKSDSVSNLIHSSFYNASDLSTK
jgi:hypothetical protein